MPFVASAGEHIEQIDAFFYLLVRVLRISLKLLLEVSCRYSIVEKVTKTYVLIQLVCIFARHCLVSFERQKL